MGKMVSAICASFGADTRAVMGCYTGTVIIPEIESDIRYPAP